MAGPDKGRGGTYFDMLDRSIPEQPFFDKAWEPVSPKTRRSL
jgi:hypothetical protein